MIGTAPAGAPAQTLEEVVVTAEKRESTVQKTPISVTAIEGTVLQAQGVTDMLTLAQQVPGINALDYGGYSEVNSVSCACSTSPRFRSLL